MLIYFVDFFFFFKFVAKNHPLNKVKIIIVFANMFFFRIVVTFYSMNYVAYKKICFDEPKKILY
jgi:hypothetical protein